MLSYGKKLFKIDKIGIHGNGLLFLCIYSNEKVFILCECICIYLYGAFLWLKIVKNNQK